MIVIQDTKILDFMKGQSNKSKLKIKREQLGASGNPLFEAPCSLNVNVKSGNVRTSKIVNLLRTAYLSIAVKNQKLNLLVCLLKLMLIVNKLKSNLKININKSFVEHTLTHISFLRVHCFHMFHRIQQHKLINELVYISNCQYVPFSSRVYRLLITSIKNCLV